jgi:protein pelota
LQELLEKSQDVLAEEDVMEEKKIMNQFFTLLATKPNIVTYGEADVKEKLQMGVTDILLLSEALPEATIEEFEKLAEPVGTKVMIISVETREGVQLKDLGKVAAILRYEVQT